MRVTVGVKWFSKWWSFGEDESKDEILEGTNREDCCCFPAIPNNIITSCGFNRLEKWLEFQVCYGTNLDNTGY